MRILKCIWAALLFFANLVAIIAASSFTFSFLGIISDRAQLFHRRVARFAKIGLVAVRSIWIEDMDDDEETSNKEEGKALENLN